MNKKNSALFSSKSDEWATPQELYGYIKGRLKFGESKNSAPFPSMVVIFRGAKA